jgi:hypothetical protein
VLLDRDPPFYVAVFHMYLLGISRADRTERF